MTLDNLSLQALGDAPGKLDQGVLSDSDGCDTSIVVAISPALLVFVEGNYVCVSHVFLYLPLLWTRRFLQGSRGETSQAQLRTPPVSVHGVSF